MKGRGLPLRRRYGHASFTGQGPLALTRVVEPDPAFGSVTFETGQPVRFTFLRNTERAPKALKHVAARYGQDIEPQGRYMTHATTPTDRLPTGWEAGTMTFDHPLVLALTLDSDGDIYGPNGWKARLVRETKKKGRALTRALLSLGYDGLVTVNKGETSEIIQLSIRPPQQGRP